MASIDWSTMQLQETQPGAEPTQLIPRGFTEEPPGTPIDWSTMELQEETDEFPPGVSVTGKAMGEQLALDGLDDTLSTGDVDAELSMEEVITDIANEQGIDPMIMLSIAQVESALNPKAKNKRSSASGLYQFIDSTWGEMVKKHGARLGVTSGDRFDPVSNTMMGVEFTKSNITGLTKALGREPTLSEVYFAHFAGLNGAKRILKKMAKNPNALVEDVWSARAMRANPSILKPGMKATEAFNILTRRVRRAQQGFIKKNTAAEEVQVQQQPTAPEGMARVEPGLFEDQDGNIVFIDGEGNIREIV